MWQERKLEINTVVGIPESKSSAGRGGAAPAEDSESNFLLRTGTATYIIYHHISPYISVIASVNNEEK
jgi:hypothetical protein